MDLELIDKYADKFLKLAQDKPITTQYGTTELFFGNAEKQLSFNSAIQNPSGAIYKFIMDTATKTQKSASFDLKAKAEPNKEASWILRTIPGNLNPTTFKLLDVEFRKIIGKSMI